MNIRNLLEANRDHRVSCPIIKPVIMMLLLTCPATRVQAAVENQSAAVLQEQVVELQMRVNRLEQQLANVMKLVQRDDAPATVTAGQSIAIRERASVSQPSIQVGGRIKVDGIYNSRSGSTGSNHNQGDLSFAPGNIPLDGRGQRDKLNFSARETRLWVTAQVPTTAATLGAYVEMDFSSADDSGNEKVSNSYVPRLRHAYVDYGGFTAGQTWTTFMNVSAFPDMNDTGGPAGIINIRQPMVRYHLDQDWGRVYLALEQPESALTTPAGTRYGLDDDQLPDIVGKVELSGAWGNWSLAGLARQLRIDSGSGIKHSTWGGAVSAAGRINVMETDNIRFALSYGNVLGRYMSLNADDDGVLDAADNIHLTDMFGAYISYQHWWSQALRSSLTLGYSRSYHDADLSHFSSVAEINESLFSSHLNLIWNLTTAATVGVEWIHGERELWNGMEGSLDRLQFTSMFRF